MKTYILFLVISLTVSYCSISCNHATNNNVKNTFGRDSTVASNEVKGNYFPVNDSIPIKKLIDSLKLDKSRFSILIDKSDYTLSVMLDTYLVKTYPVVFGGNPVDDKLKQGDECTPEGTFHMISKYPHDAWKKFIWIDYPNKSSWEKHNKAKKEGRIPKNANIGGEIGIHGVPAGYDHMISDRRNWTLGCISLTNSDIEEIYYIITKQTPIVIRK